MRNILLIAMLAILAGCQMAPKQTSPIMGPSGTIRKPGTFRYFVFYKPKFAKAAGAVELMSMRSPAIAGLDVQNMKPVEGINGFTFETTKPVEIPATKKMFMASADSSGWEIQPLLEHYILQSGPFTLQPYTCPNSPTTPVCPICPGTPTDPGTPKPVEASKSWGLTRISAMDAKARVDSSKIVVGVVDTGIDLNHPLNGNIVWKKDRTGKGSVQDGAGHGTHVAGTIAAKAGSGYGATNASLAICKGLTDQGMGDSAMLSGCLVDVCNVPGVAVVSNSWGSTQADSAISQAALYCASKGIKLFFAAGNDGRGVNQPAKLSANNANIYAVAAMQQGDTISSYSSRGPEIKVIAPGTDITSLWMGGGTNTISGTSMATPHAAAVCAEGIAAGKNPCFRTKGTVGGYPMLDALVSVQ